MFGFIEVIKKIIFLTGKNTFKLIYFNFLFIINAFIDVISIGILIPYLSILTNPKIFYEKTIFYNSITKYFLNLEYKDLILFFSLVIVLIFFLKSIISVLVQRQIAKYCYYIGGELRYILLSNYFNTEYLKIKSSNISNYIYKIQSLSMIYAKGSLLPFMRMISEIFVSILLLLLVLFVHFKSAILVTIFLVLFGIFYLRIFKKIIIVFGKKINQYNNSIIRNINESIKGFKEIKIYNKENFFLNFIDKLSSKYAQVNVNNITIAKLFRNLIELIAIVVMVSLVIYFISKNKDINDFIPILTLYALTLLRLMPSVNNIVISLNQIRLNQNSIDMLYEDLKNHSTINYFEIKNSNKKKKIIDKKFENFEKIIFKNISFAYPNTLDFIIKDFSFEINRGECIGIIGSSGSGKTSLIELLLGFIKPTTGEMKIINNNQIFEFENIINKVCYVPQEIFILDSSLKTNVTLEENDLQNENHNFYESILSKSQINNNFQSRFENKQNLGDQGSQISGGQRQRIAIARSFYQNRDILIFDEATNNLDKDTEKLIINEIKKYKGNKTIIIIAHSSEILSICDKLIKL